MQPTRLHPLLSLLVLCSLVLSACSLRPNLDRPTPPDALSSSQRAALEQAVRTFERGQDAEAQIAFEALAQQPNLASASPYIRYYQARLLLRSAPAEGAQALRSLAQELPAGDLRESAELHAGLTLAEVGDCAQGVPLLTRSLEALAPAQRERAGRVIHRCQAGIPPHAPLTTQVAAATPAAQPPLATTTSPAQSAPPEPAAPYDEDAPPEPLLSAEGAEPSMDDEFAGEPSVAVGAALSGEDLSGLPAQTVAVLLPLSGRSQRVGERLKEDLDALYDPQHPLAQATPLRMQDLNAVDDLEALFQQLSADRVAGAVGLFEPSQARAAAAAAARYGLPLVMLSLDDQALRQEGPLWRALQTPLLVARTVAGAALGRLGEPVQAQVVRSDDTYGQALGGWFAQVWQAGGGTLAPEVIVRAAEADWSSFARSVREAKAEVLFLPMAASDGARLLSHLAAAQVWPAATQRRFESDPKVREVLMFGPPEWYSPEFLRQASRYGEHVLLPVPYAAETAQGAPFAAHIQEHTQRPPSALSALIADAIGALERSAKRAVRDGNATVEQLRDAGPQEGYSAGLDFTQPEALPALILLEVLGGQFTPAP